MIDWFDNVNTTTLPIEFVDGKIQLKDGGKLPKIKNGAKAEITIPSFYIENSELKKQYNKEELFTFFKNGTELYVEMYIKNFNDLDEKMKSLPFHFENRHLVKIILKDELKIKHRGTKYPRLESCPVNVVGFDLEAKSLNEIYSKLSQIYENHRMSHTGNVFDKIYFKDGKKYLKIRYHNYL